MATRIIDLSLPLENFASEPFPPSINYYDHKAGARRLARLANVDPSDFPLGLGLASEQVTATTHSGTHVDAPYHYGPQADGKPALTIDAIPLEWCYGNGVRLDMRHKEPGSEITVKDIEQALDKMSYTLVEGDIPLLQTGADKHWGCARYVDMHSGLGYHGTMWFLNRGVKCIGIDAWGLDRPVKKMAEAIKGTGDKRELWASHFCGREKAYLQIEKMANLDKIPMDHGFRICAFPTSIDKASAGWCRAVAIIES